MVLIAIEYSSVREVLADVGFGLAERLILPLNQQSTALSFFHLCVHVSFTVVCCLVGEVLYFHFFFW